MTKVKYLPLPTDTPLLLERIVLELSTFSAEKKFCLFDIQLLGLEYCRNVW